MGLVLKFGITHGPKRPSQYCLFTSTRGVFGSAWTVNVFCTPTYDHQNCCQFGNGISPKIWNKSLSKTTKPILIDSLLQEVSLGQPDFSKKGLSRKAENSFRDCTTALKKYSPKHSDFSSLCDSTTAFWKQYGLKESPSRKAENCFGDCAAASKTIFWSSLISQFCGAVQLLLWKKYVPKKRSWR